MIEKRYKVKRSNSTPNIKFSVEKTKKQGELVKSLDELTQFYKDEKRAHKSPQISDAEWIEREKQQVSRTSFIDGDPVIYITVPAPQEFTPKSYFQSISKLLFQDEVRTLLNERDVNRGRAISAPAVIKTYYTFEDALQAKKASQEIVAIHCKGWKENQLQERIDFLRKEENIIGATFKGNTLFRTPSKQELDLREINKLISTYLSANPGKSQERLTIALSVISETIKSVLTDKTKDFDANTCPELFQFIKTVLDGKSPKPQTALSFFSKPDPAIALYGKILDIANKNLQTSDPTPALSA
jgi:hypothetical protein